MLNYSESELFTRLISTVLAEATTYGTVLCIGTLAIGTGAIPVTFIYVGIRTLAEGRKIFLQSPIPPFSSS